MSTITKDVKTFCIKAKTAQYYQRPQTAQQYTYRSILTAVYLQGHTQQYTYRALHSSILTEVYLQQYTYRALHSDILTGPCTAVYLQKYT